MVYRIIQHLRKSKLQSSLCLVRQALNKPWCPTDYFPNLILVKIFYPKSPIENCPNSRIKNSFPFANLFYLPLRHEFRQKMRRICPTRSILPFRNLDSRKRDSRIFQYLVDIFFCIHIEHIITHVQKIQPNMFNQIEHVSETCSKTSPFAPIPQFPFLFFIIFYAIMSVSRIA